MCYKIIASVYLMVVSADTWYAIYRDLSIMIPDLNVIE